MSTETASRLSKGPIFGIVVTTITAYEIFSARYIRSKYDAKIKDVTVRYLVSAKRSILASGKVQEDTAKNMANEIGELRHKMQAELPLPHKFTDKISEIMTYGKRGFNYRTLKYGKKLSDTDIVFCLSKVSDVPFHTIKGLKNKYDAIASGSSPKHSAHHASDYSSSGYYRHTDNSFNFWDFSTTNNYHGADGSNNHYHNNDDDESDGSGAAILLVIAGIAAAALAIYRGFSEFFTSKEVSKNYGQDLYDLFEKHRAEAKTVHTKGSEISKELAMKVCEEKEDLKYKHQIETPFFARIGGTLFGKFKSVDCKKLVEEKGAEKAFYSAFKSPDGTFYGNQLPEIMNVAKMLTDSGENVYPEDITSHNVQCILNACDSSGHTLFTLGCVLEAAGPCGIGS